MRITSGLRRHPLSVVAHFDHCLTLTYAMPAEVLRPLLPPGLELEEVRGHGFVAVALVQTRSLRPAGVPARLGQDFFLAGYRVFATFRTADGRTLRGLRILRSDADRWRMVIGGNVLTHYNYRHCTARVETTGDQLAIAVHTDDGRGDLVVRTPRGLRRIDWLPHDSPFESFREARRFAGPLRFTFDYEPETNSIIAIEATRTNWKPVPVTVDVERLSFFDDERFEGCKPILAAAFQVTDIDYRWERGVRYPLDAPSREAVA
jgi:hypothetical protein